MSDMLTNRKKVREMLNRGFSEISTDGIRDLYDKTIRIETLLLTYTGHYEKSSRPLYDMDPDCRKHLAAAIRHNQEAMKALMRAMDAQENNEEDY